MRNFLRKNWFGIATIAVSAAVLSLAVYNTGGTALIKAAAALGKGWLAAAFGLALVYWALETLTLNILTRTKAPGYRYRYSFRSGMIGLLYSALTPFATGGQPMQIYDMSRTGISAGDAGSVITVKSIIYQAALIVFGVVTFFAGNRFFSGKIERLNPLVVWGFFSNMIFILCVVLVCVRPGVTKAAARVVIAALSKARLIKDEEAASARVAKEIAVFHGSVPAFRDRPLTVVIAVLTTFAELFVYYSIPYCVYRSFDLRAAALWDMVSANALIALISAFFPLPGGSGAAEGSFYLFFGLFFPAELILFATLIWRAATYYSCIAAGMLVSFTGGKTPR
ncbi:MAG: flippase-like domain-containing protein [Clostridiales bacterium]|jgi:uncharacterized protein (TIRG00374 family)|nr:flippase-like domain-containing protein [Clostridiales bacterium]